MDILVQSWTSHELLINKCRYVRRMRRAASQDLSFLCIPLGCIFQMQGVSWVHLLLAGNQTPLPICLPSMVSLLFSGISWCLCTRILLSCLAWSPSITDSASSNSFGTVTKCFIRTRCALHLGLPKCKLCIIYALGHNSQHFTYIHVNIYNFSTLHNHKPHFPLSNWQSS